MKKMIAWFAANQVAANLLMGFAVLAGLAALSRIPVKLSPEVEIPIIGVTVPYLGAAPEEVESGVCARVEEQIQGLAGIKEISSTSAEGLCTVQVEVSEISLSRNNLSFDDVADALRRRSVDIPGGLAEVELAAVKVPTSRTFRRCSAHCARTAPSCRPRSLSSRRNRRKSSSPSLASSTSPTVAR